MIDDAISSSIFRHHFVMEEVSLEEMFQTMYKNDFIVVSTIKLYSRAMKMQKRFPVKRGCHSFR